MTLNEILDARLDGHTIAKALSVKIDETGTKPDSPSHKINITVDFTGWTVRQILDVAMKPLVITFQKVLRGLTVKQVMEYNGKTILASDMGKMPKGQVDVEAAFKARFQNASPEKRKEMLAELAALAE